MSRWDECWLQGEVAGCSKRNSEVIVVRLAGDLNGEGQTLKSEARAGRTSASSSVGGICRPIKKL